MMNNNLTRLGLLSFLLGAALYMGLFSQYGLYSLEQKPTIQQDKSI